MPIGFSDLLKTTAQLDNNLTKGIVSTDDTFGGVRSKIDDWTDLHLSTYNDGSGYTFQDDGTSTAPGHFKEYSTMFYVADGRALVQNDSASGTYITLDPATGEYDPSGTKFEAPSGTSEPDFWFLVMPRKLVVLVRVQISCRSSQLEERQEAIPLFLPVTKSCKSLRMQHPIREVAATTPRSVYLLM